MKEPVQVWKASDGSIHDCLGDANRAEARIVTVNEITKILDEQEEVILKSSQAYELALFLTSDERGLKIAKLLRDLEEA